MYRSDLQGSMTLIVLRLFTQEIEKSVTKHFTSPISLVKNLTLCNVIRHQDDNWPIHQIFLMNYKALEQKK